MKIRAHHNPSLSFRVPKFLSGIFVEILIQKYRSPGVEEDHLLQSLPLHPRLQPTLLTLNTIAPHLLLVTTTALPIQVSHIIHLHQAA